MKYISRHRSLETAKKRCQVESRKAIELRFVVKDGSWFKVVEEADEAVYSYFQELPRCQHCGTGLDAYRQSNCNVCGEIKGEAAGDGAAYRRVMTAFEEADLMGLTGSAFQEKVKDLISEASEKERVLKQKKRIQEQEDKKQRKERKKQREADNSLLKKNGYRWEKVAIGTEESSAPGGYGAGIGEFSHYEWELYDPKGQKVTDIDKIIRKLKA